MLKGIDISNWNESQKLNDYDFVIIKASEGKSYKDPLLDTHYNNVVRDNVELYGFYHYARPENGNTPEQEADFFIAQVGHHKGHCLYVLDWEQNALSYSTEWALKWLRRVYQKTGVKPLIYIQASQEWTGNYNNIINEDYGLWVAHWGVSKPVIKNWSFWALWQFTDSPIDTNYFNGNKETWLKYCGSPTEDIYNPVIDKGSIVRVKSRYDYNNVKNDKWVLDYSFTVLEKPQGDRVVIGINGVLAGAWNMEDLEWIG